MKPEPKDIYVQQDLLTLHRRTLLTLLDQQATSGGEQHAPPAILIAIHQARQAIQRIKVTLREWNIAVSDKPYDEGEMTLLSHYTVAGATIISLDTTLDRAPSPPEFATYLLWYLPMDRDIREAVMGDLEEEFSLVSQRFGRRKAVIWYYYQVGASFWPFAVSGLKKLIKWGIFGWVGEAIRRLIL